ncbi:pentapeptide repeat-containing protein [Streptomyces sp. NPDC056160]|uniref:pentapeptide repeat-containing protein n=1 Tax=Streptomyces sp. NPDC056160 TaxID=3345731 RepID=UPI0035D79FF8
MSTPPYPLPSAPPWPHCAHGANPATDPVGCRGIQVPGHPTCLAHLTDADRNTYLAGLAPGASIDHRGTHFTEPLLTSLLHALHDPTTQKPHLGGARFDEAQFSGDAEFGGARFSGNAGFDGAQFSRDAQFQRTQFSGNAWFRDAQFSGQAEFDEAQFSRYAQFYRAQFSGRARFDIAQFSGQASFTKAQFFGDTAFHAAQFSGDATFDDARFSKFAGFYGVQVSGNARFNRARFSATSWFGPVMCRQEVDLSGAAFEVPVTLEIAAREVRCVRTRWESTATVRLRYARVDLSHAVLSSPVAVTAHPACFTASNGPMDESWLAGPAGVRVASVQGVDAAHLVLTDTDLSDCLFAGAFHLDQLRLEGRCAFAPVPAGWHRHGLRPVRWTRRRTLAEEHHWRAQGAGQPAVAPGLPPSPGVWRTGPHHPDPDLTPDPEDVAATYRQLRKAFEDSKNEPGAADFYYGEMEMRRHDRTGTPPGERGLLHGYWLLSGYGLRASRALGWLAAAMLVTITLLMGFGLPQASPKQQATGIVPPGGGAVTFVIDKEDPQNPTGDRFTSKRFDKALGSVFGCDQGAARVRSLIQITEARRWSPAR